jgi:F0F1-type ATP synthase epsilon subunit
MPKRQLASTGEIVDVDPAKAAEEAARHMVDGKLVMDIKVYAPFKIYYDGVGTSISAVNETGPFDILPHHHKFICMLVPCDLIVRTPTEIKTIRISRALMHVSGEKVTIFVDV